jgi:hypothetical protein
VKFLQDNLLFFYPERPDIVERAEQLAAELGSRLSVPVLPWKYAWIQKVFGWPAAKRAKIIMPRYKWSLIRSADKALSLIDKQYPQGK